MQYILTQEEYDDLRRAQGVLTTNKKAELQKLATDAANFIPVPRPWSEDKMPGPWGCILDQTSSNYAGYCDDCPAKIICPSNDKEYSK